MSLPYPSMVFVPLDILTAEEMNQIVGNIESLAAGTGLDSGAITSDKIDWTTLEDSTTERVVGKTIAGNVIYERTITGTYDATANTRTQVVLPDFSQGEVAAILGVNGYVQQVTDVNGTVNAANANSGWIGPAGTFLASNMVVIFGRRPSILAYNAGAGAGLTYYLKIRYSKAS